MYEAVLFDFDGVLVDSERVHLACWVEALEPFGIRVDWETYRRLDIGVNDKLMLSRWCTTVDPPVPLEDAWSRYPLKKRLFEARMHRADAISPLMLEFLEELHRERKLAVVTSSGRSEIEPILTAADAMRFFKAAVYAEDVARHKPAPDPYLLAAQMLGTSRALVVEDSSAGLASGRAAGFDVLHIPEQSRTVELVRAALASN